MEHSKCCHNDELASLNKHLEAKEAIISAYEEQAEKPRDVLFEELKQSLKAKDLQICEIKEKATKMAQEYKTLLSSLLAQRKIDAEDHSRNITLVAAKQQSLVDKYSE